jgi:two-component system nitrate/nitrite response regulator NarL
MPIVLHGLRLRLSLEPDLSVVGEASDGVEALAKAQTLEPDVVVMDVKMPGMDGFSATERLRELVPSTAVILTSMHEDAETRMRSVRAGAIAFVAKSAEADALVSAIRRAASGAWD